MKITKRQLRRIIREEKLRLNEAVSKTDTDTIEEIIDELGAAVKMHTSQANRLQSILGRLIASQKEEE